jgi:hypothetical protein
VDANDCYPAFALGKIALHPSKSALALSSMEPEGKNTATVTQPITDAGGLWFPEFYLDNRHSSIRL